MLRLVTVDAWLDALLTRHTANLSRPEFLKAVRAVSARYVERRSELAGRSPIDSPGKRAAFAAFFAPLHFFTITHIAAALDLASVSAATILDLGCGTGVGGAAWALHAAPSARVIGVDRDAWALGEAQWNWRALDVDGRTRRADMTAVLGEPPRARGPRALLLGWSANELDEAHRRVLLPQLVARAAAGDAILIVEPIANSASPWWTDWTRALTPHGARDNRWKFEAALPDALADLDEAAGFRRDELSARTLFVPASPGAGY